MKNEFDDLSSKFMSVRFQIDQAEERKQQKKLLWEAEKRNKPIVHKFNEFYYSHSLGVRALLLLSCYSVAIVLIPFAAVYAVVAGPVKFLYRKWQSRY